jgi:hypothetical protein
LSGWSAILNDPDVLLALRVPFERMHILVNREQCATSVYAADVEVSAHGPAYYRETIRLSGRHLRLFDFQSYLCDTFRAGCAGPAQLVLILPLARLSARTRDLLHAGPLQEVERDRLALRVSSETAMRSLTISQLRPLGVTMRDYLVARGVIAVHPEPDSFGFVLDLDPLLQGSLTEVV